MNAWSPRFSMTSLTVLISWQLVIETSGSLTVLPQPPPPPPPVYPARRFRSSRVADVVSEKEKWVTLSSKLTHYRGVRLNCGFAATS